MATNNTYTNIKDILIKFENTVVKARHYTKDEVYTQSQTIDAITAAIANVHQFNIVKSSSAANTPKGVVWRVDSTNSVTGKLEARAADKHTIYYVPSENGTDDNYDEYMALTTGSDTYVWEKIGNTDVNLTNYVKTSRTINGKALSSDISITKNDVGLEYVANVGTDSTLSPSSTNNITSAAVYAALNKAITESTSHGIKISGKVNAPTITVTPGSIEQDNASVVTGGAVYAYAQKKDADLTAIAGLADSAVGFLKKTGTNTWAVDSSTYATTGAAIGVIDFDSTKGLRMQYASKGPSMADSDWDIIASIATLKSGLGINDKANKTTTISASNSGVELGGTISNPTITVTGGSVALSNGSVVKGGTVYDYISGSSGVLYMSDNDFADILTNV